MELIHLGMNDPTSIYGNFTFYLVKYGEPTRHTLFSDTTFVIRKNS